MLTDKKSDNYTGNAFLECRSYVILLAKVNGAYVKMIAYMSNLSGKQFFHFEYERSRILSGLAGPSIQVSPNLYLQKDFQ